MKASWDIEISIDVQELMHNQAVRIVNHIRRTKASTPGDLAGLIEGMCRWAFLEGIDEGSKKYIPTISI